MPLNWRFTVDAKDCGSLVSQGPIFRSELIVFWRPRSVDLISDALPFRSAVVRLPKRGIHREAHDNGLDEIENGKKLVISLVSCDRSHREAGERKQNTDEVLRP